MQKITIPYELLFRFGLNATQTGGEVKGAHYKTLTLIVDDGEVVSEKEGPALNISESDPTLMAEAIGSLNAAMVMELNDVKIQLGQVSEAGAALEKTHNELVVTHNTLVDHNLASLAELDGTRISLDKANSDLEALEKESETVHLALGNSESEVRSLEARVAELEQQLSERIELHEADVKKANTTIQAGTEWTREAESKIALLTQENSELSQRLQAYENSVTNDAGIE